MTIKERITKYIDYKGLENSRFEKRAGLGNGYVDKIREGIRSTTIEKIRKSFPDLNIEWLKTGEGDMLLSESKNITTNITPVPRENYKMVEYVDLRASAGRLGIGDVELLPETHTRLVPIEFDNGNFLVVRVDGDSMDDNTKRALSDGDEVLICERKDYKIEELPIKKSLFVITTRDGNVLKQIVEVNVQENYIVCRSFNKTYEDFKIEITDIYQIFIVCKVVQKQISLN